MFELGILAIMGMFLPKEQSQKEVLCSYKVKKDVIEFLMDDSESIEFDYLIDGESMTLDCILMMEQTDDGDGISSGIKEESLHIELER